GWLVHGCAGNHGGAFPGGEGLPVPVVAGDHRVVVAGIVQVADFLDARQRCNLPAAAERLVHPLSRMRQERGEHGVQVIDGLGGGVQHGALALRVFLLLPRGCLGQVAVDLPTRRIASWMAPRWRWVLICRPTSANPDSVWARMLRSASVSSPGVGMAPKFLWIRLAVRLTRLPQPATSSSLVRRLNSDQVKSESCDSGPATAMKYRSASG